VAVVVRQDVVHFRQNLYLVWMILAAAAVTLKTLEEEDATSWEIVEEVCATIYSTHRLRESF